MAEGGLKAEQIRIAGTGHIYVGDADTVTLPTTEVSALSSAWTDLGYTTEDGVTFNVERETESVMSWQSKRPVRKFNQSQLETLTAELQQWNEVTLVTTFGGGAVSEPTPGHYKYEFPDAGDAIEDVAVIVDWEDDGYHYRLVFPRANAVDETEINLTRTAESTLPLSMEAIEAPVLWTDDPSFEAQEGS